jgi:hypothetical protein
MNNLLSYCGLVEARISASEKDLPVTKSLSYNNRIVGTGESCRKIRQINQGSYFFNSLNSFVMNFVLQLCKYVFTILKNIKIHLKFVTDKKDYVCKSHS